MDEIKNKDEYNPDIVTLSDDDGKEYTFEVLDAIETETGRYLAMLPIYDDPQKTLDDSGELVIVKVGEEEENGAEYYYELEVDEEYDMIADAFVERREEFFEIGDKDDKIVKCPALFADRVLYSPTTFKSGPLLARRIADLPRLCRVRKKGA